MFKEPNFSQIQESLETFNIQYQKGEMDAKLPTVRSISRQRSFDLLSQHLQAGKLTLVLGAGTSADFNLPGWQALLQKLLLNSMDHDLKTASVLAQLFIHLFSPSPLIAGRYLKQTYEGKKQSFSEAVRKALYAEAELSTNSNLMQEITELCRTQEDYQLDSVITYNYDDILEQHLKQAKIKHRAIYGEQMKEAGEELKVYHVHGFLPRRGKLKAEHEIVLGEDLYHQQYQDIYSWTNIIQIDKFRTQNCLLIGVSLTDPNLRRLLDIARFLRGKETKKYHYLIKRRYNQEEVKTQLQKLLNNNRAMVQRKVQAQLNVEDTVKHLVQIIERFDEQDAQSFGVKILWVEEFNEIPDLLASIRT